MNYPKNKFKKLIPILLIASFAVVVSFLFLPLTKAQAAPNCEETFQPSGGLNDGTDDGSALNGKDTYISSTKYGEFDPDLGSSVNFGTRAELFFDYYWNYDGYPLLKFDVSTLPSDIASAKLYLYATSNCGGGSCPNMDWTVNAITSPWDEMTATWNTRPTLSGSYGTLNIPASPTGIENARWVSVDITALYNGWKNGTITNYGIGFTRLGSAWDGGVWFNHVASSDYDTASLRPKLVIESACSQAALNPGDVLVVDPSAPGEAGVFKIDSSTWQATLISSNGYFAEPMGIALSSDGNILIGDPQYPNGSGPGAIFKINPANGEQTILSSGNLFTDPRGIAVAANGDIFVADPDAFNYYGGVIKVDPSTGTQTKIYQSVDINAGPVYLAFEANGSLVVSDVSGTSKGVVRVNPTTGAGVQLAAGGNFVYPHGIVVAVNGDIFVADNAGKIIKVNPVSGTQTVIASGYPLACPVGLAFDNSGDLLVSDPCNEPGAIIKVNPATGAANVVANNFGSISPNGIVVVSQLQTCVTPPPGMVSWWPGDDNSNDLIGGNTGTLQNGATFASGKVGRAFSFDGINDYVSVNSRLDTAEDFSVDFWMNPRFFREDPIAVIMRSGNYAVWNEFGFLVHMTGNEMYSWGAGKDRVQLQVYYPTTTGTSQWINLLGPAITESNWNHVAFTYDADTLQLSLYINGVLVDNKDVTQELASKGLTPSSAVTNDLLVFGADYWNINGQFAPNGQAFPGELDEIEFFNRSLNAGEVQSIYNAGSLGKCKQPAAVCGNGIVEGTEQCDGGGCCTASCTFQPSNYICRASTGACDPVEQCTGSSATCPINIILPDSDGDGIPDSIDACDNSLAPAGMTGCWGLNETSGTTAADSSGNNNTGTLVNNPSWIAGKVNNGLSFSNGQYVQVPHNSNLNIAGNLTIDMWINPNSVTCAGADPGYVLISKRTTNTGQPYTFYIGCGGSLRLNYWSTAGPSPFPTFVSTGAVSTGAWQHVAVTRSLSGNDATVTFYINGVVAGSSVQTTGAAYTNSHPVWISKDGYFTGYTNQGSYSGLIDEVAIYNRVLSAAEIQQHYQNGLQGKGYCEAAPADTQPPIITVPSDIVVEATSPAGAEVIFEASATDNIGVVSFACSPSSGSVFPIGDTTVTCTASDAAGNSASASFSVMVNPPAGYTEAGDNIAVTLDAGVFLTFSSITNSGITTVSVSSTGPALPTQFKLGNPPIYYDISTTAFYAPPIEVCFSYAGANYQNENNLKLRHFDGANWTDITKPGYPDTVNDIICGITDSLSPFAITEPAEQDVLIDIKPGSFPNSLNLKSSGKIPVAILSTFGFNALTQTNKTSLTFGRTGDEKSLSFCNANGEDVNKDGFLDLVCHFQTQQADFQIGNTEGNLKGKTVGGIPLAGKDSVRLVPAN